MQYKNAIIKGGSFYGKSALFTMERIDLSWKTNALLLIALYAILSDCS